MRIYLAADIEGSCGFTLPEEGTVGTPWYPYFAREMTMEVVSACRGAHAGGASDILVHDAHDTARNIDPALLPPYVRLMRRSGADPFAMVSGLDREKFDALFLTGFHSWAGSRESAAAHTFNHTTYRLTLNDMPLSEFLFDAYSAAYLGVPTVFVSGDENICRFAKALIPSVTTVSAVRGIGAGSVSRSPAVVQAEIEEKSRAALSVDPASCLLKLPSVFRFTVSFYDHINADFNSFYPGMRRVDDCTLSYETDDWYDILTMVHFVLDK